MKQAASEQFLASLRRVLDGGIYVSEAVGSNMIQKFASGGAYISANPISPNSSAQPTRPTRSITPPCWSDFSRVQEFRKS